MGRFDDRATMRRGPKDIFRWRILEPLKGNRPRRVEPFTPPFRDNDGSILRTTASSLTWVGHATFVLRLGRRTLATDPIWSNRIAGAVARVSPPGVRLEDVPPIDVVTISHNHFDHLDLPTLRRIGPKATYVVPLGCGPLLENAGLRKIVELDWWQTHREEELAITHVPSRHWSMRMPWTRNESLWGGFVIKSPESTVYHAGDTAYFDGFREIGARLGRIDLALLPIGAYDPRWFMETQHMSPEEAGEAFLHLGAEKLVAMHWGTFRLTDEPLAEPPKRIEAWWRTRGLPSDRLIVMDIGETRPLKG